jgi:hypothetical protein
MLPGPTSHHHSQHLPQNLISVPDCVAILISPSSSFNLLHHAHWDKPMPVYMDGSNTIWTLVIPSFGHLQIPCPCRDLLSLLKKHITGIVMRRKHPKRCVVCGKQAFLVCTLCNNKAMHWFPQKGQNGGSSCFINYHNNSFFGLTYDDIKLVNKQKSKWSPANQTKQRNNKKYINNLKGMMMILSSLVTSLF